VAVALEASGYETPWSRLLLEKLIVPQLLKIFHAQGSLSYLQEPAYPDSNESSPNIHTLFLSDTF
jgi:hypothetical protein